MNKLIKYISDKRFLKWFIIIFATGYITIEITQNTYIMMLIGILINIFILISIPKVKGSLKNIIYILVALTLILLIYIGDLNVFHMLFEGALINLPIVTILVLTPLLGITVKTGDYISHLKVLLKSKKNNALFFYISYLTFTHVFAIIINIGSVIINYNLMGSSNVQSKRLMSTALNRGYASITVWSPYLGVMILVLGQLKLEWFILMKHTILFAVLSILFAIILEINLIKEENCRLNEIKEESNHEIEKSFKFQKLIELSLIIILPMLIVLLFSVLTQISITLVIAFVSIFFPVIWTVLKGEWLNYQKEFNKHINEVIPNLKNEFTLFLLAGIFGHLFVISDLGSEAVNAIISILNGNSIIISIIISSIIIGCGIVGVHPVVLLTVFVTGVSSYELGFNEIYYALLLLGSSGIAMTISPATAVNNLTASMIKEDILKVSLKWNWKYALVMYSILIFYLQLLY